METFEERIICSYGLQGQIWLESLHNQVQTIADQWQLSKLKPVENLSYNYVLSGFRKNEPVILKLSFDTASLEREMHTLNVFDGFGAVKVLDYQSGALLLERAVPGNSLKSYYPQCDNEAIEIICTAMKNLHQAPLMQDHKFPHIRDWLSALNKDWNIPKTYLEKAKTLRDELLKDAENTAVVLLHGDLHHDNILSNNSEWKVIDPKGVIGYPVNEIWAPICNPLTTLSANVIQTRVDVYAEQMNLDKKLIINWCFVQSVLSWAWDLEDNLNPSTTSLTKIFDLL